MTTNRTLAEVAATEARVVLWRNLEALMRARWGGVKVRQLAREIGGSPATVTRLRQGAQDVGLDLLYRIAAVFGLEGWQLLAGVSDERPTIAFSPQALDLADTLDHIADERVRAQAYALSMHVLHALQNGAAPSFAPVSLARPRVDEPAAVPKQRQPSHRRS